MNEFSCSGESDCRVRADCYAGNVAFGTFLPSDSKLRNSDSEEKGEGDERR